MQLEGVDCGLVETVEFCQAHGNCSREFDLSQGVRISMFLVKRRISSYELENIKHASFLLRLMFKKTVRECLGTS